MSRSLDEAIRLNNEWETQKKDLDRKWQDELRKSSAQTAPHIPFDEQISIFLKLHEKSIRDYIAELSKDDSGSEKAQHNRQRASHLELMLDQLANNPKRVFERKHDKALREELWEAGVGSSECHSSDHAPRMREAASAIEKLAAEFKEHCGPLL